MLRQQRWRQHERDWRSKPSQSVLPVRADPRQPASRLWQHNPTLPQRSPHVAASQVTMSAPRRRNRPLTAGSAASVRRSLGQNQLSGTIPAALGNLTQLQSLCAHSRAQDECLLTRHL